MRDDEITGADRRAARTLGRWTGALYACGTICGVLSLVLFADRLDAPELLSRSDEARRDMRLGAVAVLGMAVALALVPAVAAPVLVRVNAAMTLAYGVMRSGVEMVLYVLMAALWALATLPAGEGGGALTALLVAQPQVLNPMLTLVFCLGAGLFYLLLLRGRLVPRWIALWGLLGLPLYAASAPLVLMGAIGPFSTAQTLLNLPVAAQEMVLALYLMRFGFRVPGATPRHSQAVPPAHPFAPEAVR